MVLWSIGMLSYHVTTLCHNPRDHISHKDIVHPLDSWVKRELCHYFYFEEHQSWWSCNNVGSCFITIKCFWPKLHILPSWQGNAFQNHVGKLIVSYSRTNNMIPYIGANDDKHFILLSISKWISFLFLLLILQITLSFLRRTLLHTVSLS